MSLHASAVTQALQHWWPPPGDKQPFTNYTQCTSIHHLLHSQSKQRKTWSLQWIHLSSEIYRAENERLHLNAYCTSITLTIAIDIWHETYILILFNKSNVLETYFAWDTAVLCKWLLKVDQNNSIRTEEWSLCRVNDSSLPLIQTDDPLSRSGRVAGGVCRDHLRWNHGVILQFASSEPDHEQRWLYWERSSLSLTLSDAAAAHTADRAETHRG